MKERPVLFSGEMVRATLEDRKTQTRRVVKPQPSLIGGRFEFTGLLEDAWPEPGVWLALSPSGKFGLTDPPYYRCPYGIPGDRLWVREKFYEDLYIKDGERPRIYYPADGRIGRGDYVVRGHPSIHMPRWASRITLEVMGVRVERLQEISIDDLLAEGWPPSHSVDQDGSEAYEWFSDLWESLNAKRGYPWEANPWVWVIEFKKRTPYQDVDGWMVAEEGLIEPAM